MTILFSSDTVNRGGKEKQLTMLASGLLERGYNVYIVVERFQPENNYFSEYQFPPEHLFVYNGFNDFRKIISKVSPHIGVSWEGKSSAYQLLTSRQYGYRFINFSIQHGIRLTKYSHYLRSFIAWISPYVMANTRAGLYVNNMKPGKNRFVLNNGVDRKFRYKKSEYEKREMLSCFFPKYADHPVKVFISIANFLPFKDYFTVFKALHKLRPRKPFVYLIIGDGPLKQELINMIEKLNLDDAIKLVGRVDNVEDYLAVSDYYIHSSKGEGMSNAILEAMYAGLPVIATNVGGVPETVYKDSSALFPYKDHNKLYNVLLHIDDVFKSFDPDSEEYRSHLELFSVDRMISNFEDIIRKVNSN